MRCSAVVMPPLLPIPDGLRKGGTGGSGHTSGGSGSIDDELGGGGATERAGRTTGGRCVCGGGNNLGHRD